MHLKQVHKHKIPTDPLVSLPEHVPPLGMPQDNITSSAISRHLATDLSREGSLGALLDVLGCHVHWRLVELQFNKVIYFFYNFFNNLVGEQIRQTANTRIQNLRT